MLLALLLLPILAAASPFHKYPYVFLLDVGNEELEKVDTEQIRLSSPGGSVALRYPAIGNGDDIAHVRVTGIDFGTDLKANIVDGGPGYKYVVIVLLGNSGVEYDAVITIQTVPNIVDDSVKTIDDNSIGNPDESVTNQEYEDNQNNSAEDLTDYEDSSKMEISNKNGELTQESSNVYSYSQNEALSGYGGEHNGESEINKDGDDSDEDDSTGQLEENIYQRDNVKVEDYNLEEDSRLNQPLAEKYTADDDYSQSDSNQPIIVDQNLYNKYIALKDHLYVGSEVYPQDEIEQSNLAYGFNQNYDDRVDNEAYDYYEENNPNSFRDANNNFIDTDEASAVEQ